MTRHDDGGLVFSVEDSVPDGAGGYYKVPEYGMTLYDAYVGMASIVLVLSAGLVKASNDAAGEEFARPFNTNELLETAEEWADAMIARKREREREE